MAGLFGNDMAGRIASRMVQEEVDDDLGDELFSMSIRVPMQLRAYIDAMAEHTGVSRNSMVIDLLRAGVEDVNSRLPDAIRDELAESAGGYL